MKKKGTTRESNDDRMENKTTVESNTVTTTITNPTNNNNPLAKDHCQNQKGSKNDGSYVKGNKTKTSIVFLIVSVGKMWEYDGQNNGATRETQQQNSEVQIRIKQIWLNMIKID